MKTLKDLYQQWKVLSPDLDKKEREWYIVRSNDLKQTAIEWVKELRKNSTQLQAEVQNELTKDKIFMLDNNSSAYISGFIMYFFNLTEEDLK